MLELKEDLEKIRFYFQSKRLSREEIELKIVEEKLEFLLEKVRLEASLLRNNECCEDTKKRMYLEASDMIILDFNYNCLDIQFIETVAKKFAEENEIRLDRLIAALKEKSEILLKRIEEGYYDKV